MDESSVSGTGDGTRVDVPHGTRTIAAERLLLEQVERIGGVGSWQWFLSTGELRWSRHLYQIFGLDAGGPPVPFERADTMFSAATWPRLRQAVLETIDGGGMFEVEVEFRRSDGSWGWAIARGQALPDGEGRPAQVLGTVQDVTKRKQAELALRMSEARLRAIFDSAGDSMVIMDEALTIVMANQASARMHGCSVDQLIGTKMHEWLPERHRGLLEADVQSQADQELLSHRRGRQDGLTCLHADGHEFPVEVTLTQMHVNGQRFFAAAARDITSVLQARHALERSRNDLRKLVSRMLTIEERVRRRIARDLHDELQQPLAAIRMDAMAMVGPLASGAFADAPARIAAVAGDAIAATRRIVNDLRPRVLDDLGLSAALRAMVDGFSTRTGMRCECQVLGPDGADETLAAELTDCLYRVAQESLNNIFRHARAGHAHVLLDLTGGDGVLLRITDDGKGIRSEDLQKPDSFGILGMDERVSSLNGRLRVEPAPAGGTLVEAVLPLRPPSA
jgi:PAS domain S-box-containing protein